MIYAFYPISRLISFNSPRLITRDLLSRCRVRQYRQFAQQSGKGIDLLGPARGDSSWQARLEGDYRAYYRSCEKKQRFGNFAGSIKGPFELCIKESAKPGAFGDDTTRRSRLETKGAAHKRPSPQSLLPPAPGDAGWLTRRGKCYQT